MNLFDELLKELQNQSILQSFYPCEFIEDFPKEIYEKHFKDKEKMDYC